MKINKTTKLKNLLGLALASGLLIAPIWGGEKTIELAFITHLDAGMPEQDVYIEREPGSGKVFRVTAGDHNMSAPLFATATETEHDPFDPAAVGPHEKGEAMGMTLGERDGSSSAFEADENGKAAFVHMFKPCLQMSDTWTTSMPAPKLRASSRA